MAADHESAPLPEAAPAPADPFRIPAADPAARRYENGKLAMGLAQSGIELAALAALVAIDGGRTLVNATGLGQIHPVIAAPLLALLIAAGLEILTLPLSFRRGHVWERRFGLSNQSRAEWLKDYLKGAALGLALLALGVVVIYAGMSIAPVVWWLVSGLALFGGFALLARITPTLLLPIFFKFEPLDRPDLRARLDALAAGAGLLVEGIYLWNLSEKTRAANAAFTGTGRSRRVILSDTLLEQFTEDEIEAVFAHELGHWRLRHIAKGLAMQGAAVIVLLGAAHVVMRLAAPQTAIHDPALLPLLGLTLFVAGMIMAPLAMAMSRRFEFQADAYAIRAHGRPEPFLDALRKLATQNLADPAPPRWIERLFHSHPSIARRIEALKDCQKSVVSS